MMHASKRPTLAGAALVAAVLAGMPAGALAEEVPVERGTTNVEGLAGAETDPAEGAADAEGSEGPRHPPFDEPPPGFERVTGAGVAQEQIDPVPLVIAAYLVIWALVLGFLVLLWLRHRRVRGEMEALARRLEAQAGGEERREAS